MPRRLLRYTLSLLERGTSENTNGLIRQYFPKGKSMAHVTQADCDIVAQKLNQRPRQRLDYAHPGGVS